MANVLARSILEAPTVVNVLQVTTTSPNVNLVIVIQLAQKEIHAMSHRDNVSANQIIQDNIVISARMAIMTILSVHVSRI